MQPRNNDILTPSQLNTLARDLLEGSFPAIWVEAELGSVARPASGHLYFTLKDARAQLRAAMFRMKAQYLKFVPREGMRVLVRGKVTLYDARGEYQMVLDHMEEAGEGALRRAFEELKARLEAEGLFDPARKRPLPAHVQRLAVITSPTGAAVRDVLSVLGRRFPLLEVDLLPTLVQGSSAAAQITRLLQAADASGRYDVILLTRGGGSLEEALSELESGAADAVVVLENDLHRHASAARVDAALSKAPLVMVIDHQRTAIMDKAHLVLSAASFAESDGTVVNNEGRAQRFFQVYDPAYYDNSIVMLESWRWLHSLHSTVLSREVDWTQLDHVIDAAVAKLPQLAGIKDAAPEASFRIRGQKLAREPHRYSGRTAMRANISVHEPRQPQDKDTMFAFSMEGNNQPSAPRSQIPFAWAPGWNSPQAWNKFQAEVGGSLRHGDPGVRLIEASETGLAFFSTVPASFQAEEGNWRIAPYYHLFGSDEMSQRSPVFQTRMPQPYIKLNPADAAKLGVNAGANISFSYEGQTISLPLIISEGLTAGQVGLPMGMPGIAPVLAGARLDNLQEAKA